MVVGVDPSVGGWVVEKCFMEELALAFIVVYFFLLTMFVRSLERRDSSFSSVSNQSRGEAMSVPNGLRIDALDPVNILVVFGFSKEVGQLVSCLLPFLVD